MLYKDSRNSVHNRTVEHKNGMIKMGNIQKEVQVKLAKGLLDLIVLEFLSTQPMHGYQIITKIRKNFGVYFGPSTIYPLLATLEKKESNAELHRKLVEPIAPENRDKQCT